MNTTDRQQRSILSQWGPILRAWPLTGKVLVTMIINTISRNDSCGEFCYKHTYHVYKKPCDIVFQ